MLLTILLRTTIEFIEVTNFFKIVHLHVLIDNDDLSSEKK